MQTIYRCLFVVGKVLEVIIIKSLFFGARLLNLLFNCKLLLINVAVFIIRTLRFPRFFILLDLCTFLYNACYNKRNLAFIFT